MPIRHTIRPGDCIASVSLKHGFAPDTVWNDAANSALREVRESGYHLVPGDVLVVPDREPKKFTGATGQQHIFRRRGVPEKLFIRLLDDHEPRAEVPYVLVVDGKERTGTTSGDGVVEEWIRPDAREGELFVEDDPPIQLTLGQLMPVTEPAGVRDRLINLGALAPDDADAEPEITVALMRFQDQYELPATGLADDETVAKLVEIHGA